MLSKIVYHHNTESNTWLDTDDTTAQACRIPVPRRPFVVVGHARLLPSFKLGLCRLCWHFDMLTTHELEDSGIAGVKALVEVRIKFNNGLEGVTHSDFILLGSAWLEVSVEVNLLLWLDYLLS